MKQRSIRIGEVLVLEGLITADQLVLALKIQKETGDFLGDVLVKRKWISENQLSTALSQQFDIPFCSLDFDQIDWSVPQHYPSLIAEQNCFPIAHDSSSVTVAISNPLDAWTMSQVELQSRGRDVKLVLATKTQIRAVIDELRKRSLR